MHRLMILLALVAGVACERANANMDKRFDEVVARLDKIDQRLTTIEKRPAGPAPGAAQRARPDGNTVYAIPVDDRDAVRGAKHAKVTLVEAFEFACPYCAQLSPTMEALLQKYPKDLRIVSKQYVVHPQVATYAALGACAANKQGKYTAYEHELWAKAWPVGENGQPRMDRAQLEPAALEKIAAAAGLDPGKFKADSDGPCKAEIEQKQRELQAFGVSGTPAIYLNGRFFAGNRSVEGLSAAIDEEIKKADDAIRGGVRVEDVYANIMKTGKKSL